jgi:hypothetical protein
MYGKHIIFDAVFAAFLIGSTAAILISAPFSIVLS